MHTSCVSNGSGKLESSAIFTQLIKLTTMKNTEYVNCYCFNPACADSIFNTKSTACIKYPLSQVLIREFHCPTCNSELVSKPVLNMRLEVYRSLKAEEPEAEHVFAH
jgi:hypothetical protein